MKKIPGGKRGGLKKTGNLQKKIGEKTDFGGVKRGKKRGQNQDWLLMGLWAAGSFDFLGGMNDGGNNNPQMMRLLGGVLAKEVFLW